MHSFNIARLELKRKRTEFSKKTLLLVIPLLLVFVAIFAYISITDYQPNTPVLGIQTNDPLINEYVQNSILIPATPTMANSIILNVEYNTEDEKYYVVPASLPQRSAQTALFSLLQSKNSLTLQEFDYVPPVLLNISSVDRVEGIEEAILDQDEEPQEEQVPATIPNIEELAEQQTQQGSVTDVPEETPQQQTEEESPPVVEEQNEVQDSESITTTIAEQSQNDEPLGTISFDVTQNLNLNDEAPVNLIQDAEASDDAFSTIEELDTLQHIRHVFIAIQIIVVLNFTAVLFASSLFQEKLNMRSTLLFTAPISRTNILIGKMVPYFVLSEILILALLFINGMPAKFLLHSFIITIILSCLYFSIAYLAAVFARSHKEFSFVSVFMISLISLYLIVPAFIANYSLISNASLITPLVLFVQGIDVAFSTMLFLLVVYGFLAFWLFRLGMTLFNFEEFYSYSSMPAKILRMAQLYCTNLLNTALFTFMSIPIGWLVQVVLIVVLLVSGVGLSAGVGAIAIFLIIAALIEETLRNLPIYAQVTRSEDADLHMSWKKGLLFSAAAGIGFALGEKLLLTIMIAPFVEGYQQIISGAELSLPLFFGKSFGVAALLHSAFSFFFFMLLKLKANMPFPVAVILTTIVHAGYNLILVAIFGGSVF